MDPLSATKDPVRVAVKHTFLDCEGGEQALSRAELAQRRRSDASVKYEGNEGEEHAFEYARDEEDYYENSVQAAMAASLPMTGVYQEGLPFADEDLDVDSRHLSGLPPELRRGSLHSQGLGSRRSSHVESRRTSIISIMTGNGWESQEPLEELGAWGWTQSRHSVMSTGSHRTSRSHRPSLLARGLPEEECGSDDDMVERHVSCRSWVTDMGESSQDLQHLHQRLGHLQDPRNGMPYTSARGNDAGARVPQIPAAATVPRLGGQPPDPAVPLPVLPPASPATSSWSHAYGGAAAGPPPYYPSVHMAQAQGLAPPYCAAGWHPGYYSSSACWQQHAAPLPMHYYGHGQGAKPQLAGRPSAAQWVPGGCAPDGGWLRPSEAGRAGYGVHPVPHSAGYNEPSMSRTTVMLRNMPDGFSRDNLTGMLGNVGFAGRYDFVYMPMNFRTKASFGYAFVNMVSPEDARRCHDTFQGFRNWGVPTDKVCEVSWSDMHQGLAAHIDRYRNSPVMHESVPDEYKPVIFAGGKRVTFPPPTKKLRQPRIRRSTEDGDEDDMEEAASFPTSNAMLPDPGIAGTTAAWLSPPQTHLRGPR